MRNFLLGCGCVALILVSSASASTVYLGTNFLVNASTPVPVGINLQAVTLTAVGLNGALPNSFDGITGGLTGITTLGNSLHQVWEFGASPTPTNTLIVPANSIFQPIDTHFLVNNASIISLSAPSENRPVTDVTEHGLAGYGKSLTGIFALTGAPASTWDFAYLVTPLGATINLDFRLGDGGGQLPSELVSMSFAVVPEPASLVLLAVGAIGVGLARFSRRRRARSA